MNIYVLISLILMIPLSVAIYYIATRRGQNKTVFLILSLFSAFIMVATFIFEVSATNMSEAKQALYIQFLGYFPFGLFFTLETFRACGYKIKRRYIILGTLYCFVVFIIGFTNDIHGLYYSKFYFNIMENGNGVLTYDHGIIGKLALYISYTFIVVATTNIVINYSKRNNVLKKQLNYFLIGVCLMVFVHVLELVKIIDLHYILTYYELAIASLIYTYGVYKMRNLDLEASAIDICMKSMKNEVVVLDKNWHFVYANESAILRNDSLGKLLQGDSIKNTKGLPDVLKQVHEVGIYDLETNKDGKKIYMEYSVDTIVERKKVIGYILTFNDITNYKTKLYEEKTIARTDTLVKIYNRRGFFDKINKLSCEEFEKTSLALIDVDHFKKVNDTYGHDVGDVVLVELGELLKKSITGMDVVARYGGEEFIIAIVNNDFNLAVEKLELLRKTIEMHNFGTVGKVTVSIGVTRYNGIESSSNAIKKADEALYEAKRVSRNAVFYYDKNEDKVKSYKDLQK